MKSILSLSARFPIIVLLLLGVMTTLFALQIPHLKIELSAQSMLVKNDPLWLGYQQALKTFGSDNITVIYLHDEALFTPDKLRQSQQLLHDLQSLPFVESSKSLFNVANVREQDEYIRTDPFLKVLPQTPEQSQAIINAAVANPLVVNNLIAADGKSMAINLRIAHQGFTQQQISSEINTVLAVYSGEFERLFQMGTPFIMQEISRLLKLDQTQIMPAALIVLLLALSIGLRRYRFALVPILTSAVSIVITMGLMVLLGFSVNIMTSLVPALLIIIGSTEDIHLLAEYEKAIDAGHSRQQALELLPTNQWLALSLAFITTFFGFLSITISELELLREFGMLMSAGLTINFMVTLMLVPAYLRLFGHQQSTSRARGKIMQNIAHRLFLLIIRFKLTVLVLLSAILLFFIWGTQYLRVDNNTLAYFSKDSTVIQRVNTVAEDISGVKTFSIILRAGIVDTFLKVQYLEEIEQIQEFLASRPLLDKSFSLADFIKLTHQVMEGESGLMLPEEDEVAAAYMGLVDFKTVSDFVTADFATARILVRHNIGATQQMEQELAIIQDFIEQQMDSPLQIEFTGESVLSAHATDSMALGQVQSLIIMIVVILLLVSILFIDIRAGLLALAPNIYPVVVLFGIMGYLDIPLDTGTTMVAIIALGICVDDTIHFLSRYHFFTRGNQDVEKALLMTVEHEAMPIITTSLALACGFSTLVFSSFQPVIYFGALSALVMLLALVSTFILLPILLSYTRLITVWDMLSLNLKTSVLQNSALFRGLRGTQIKQAILSGEIRHFDDDQIMVEQGSQGSEMYVILEGEARVTQKASDGSIRTADQLGPGELFGEVSLLTEQTRTARVSANGPTRVLILHWKSINELGRYHPRISLKLFRNLSSILSQRFSRQISDEKSLRDELTGVLTKQYLCEQLKLERQRCLRHQEVMSTILMDIEFLDPASAPTCTLPEQAIRDITLSLAEQTRRVDIFARWDESRFFIVLPRTPAEKALEIMRRMKQSIESQVFGESGRIHILAAVTESDGAEDTDNMIKRLENELSQLRGHEKSLHVTLA